MPATLRPYLLTYYDLLEYARELTDKNNTARTTNLIYAAVQEAMRTVTQSHTWQYLYKYDRIDLNAYYDTGTVTYDVASNVMTLSGGTWPDWTTQGWVKIPTDQGINYQVQSRLTDTTLELNPNLKPTEDITTASTYTLFQSSYLLPADWRAMAEPIHQDWIGIDFVDQDDALFQETRIESFGTPYNYTIQGSGDFRGQFEAKFFPAPDQDRPLHFMYIRRPRPMTVSGYAKRDKVGTVTTDGSTTTLTGTSTQFNDVHVGALVMLSADSTPPTGRDGLNPFVDQRTVVAVNSATSITLDQAPAAYTNVAYVISDYADIDESMANYLFRAIDYSLNSRSRDRKLVDQAFQMAIDAERRAKEADSRLIKQRYAQPLTGTGGWGRTRIWNPRGG